MSVWSVSFSLHLFAINLAQYLSVCKFAVAIGIDRVWLLIGCVYPLLVNIYVFQRELCWKMSFCFKSCFWLFSTKQFVFSSLPSSPFLGWQTLLMPFDASINRFVIFPGVSLTISPVLMNFHTSAQMLMFHWCSNDAMKSYSIKLRDQLHSLGVAAQSLGKTYVFLILSQLL